MNGRRVLEVGGKINLHLEILGRRDDGYHDLRTLMLPLKAPLDRLEITPGAPGSGLTLRCEPPELETPSNLVARAWSAHAKATGFAPDLEVRLTKAIPMGAGLGGGSANAAAMLTLSQELAGERALGHAELIALAAKLGADAPFFLLGGPAWAEGIGERLTPTTLDLSGWTLLLLCPDEGVNTGWAYGEWDEMQKKGVLHPPSSLTGAVNDCRGLDFSSAIRLFNSFEQVILPRRRELCRLKERCLVGGAAGAMMSGSGSSIFALFREERDARRLAGQLVSEVGCLSVQPL